MDKLPGFTPLARGRFRCVVDLDPDDAERVVLLAQEEATRTGERLNVAGMLRRVVRSAVRPAGGAP